MAYERQATGRQVYDYPVELVWAALMNNSSTKNLVDPLDEKAYEGDPRPGTMYTRSLEVVTNKRFSFEVKTSVFTTVWNVEMESLGPCETELKVTETAKFSDFKNFLRCRMGMGLPGEVRYFLRDAENKLRNYEKKMKMR